MWDAMNIAAALVARAYGPKRTHQSKAYHLAKRGDAQRPRECKCFFVLFPSLAGGGNVWLLVAGGGGGGQGSPKIATLLGVQVLARRRV